MTAELYWWMREDVAEARFANEFCSHIICPTPHTGVRSIEDVNPSYVQTYWYDRWDRYYDVLEGDYARDMTFVTMNSVLPIYASDEWFATHSPLNPAYWTTRARKASNRKARAQRRRGEDVLSMVDLEVYGDARTRFGWRDVDAVLECKAMTLGGFNVDIGFPFTEFELYALGSRFVGARLMGTKYSPASRGPKENSDMVQIIVVADGEPNDEDRFRIADAEDFIRASEIPVMIFPNGKCSLVAKQLAARMGEVTEPDANRAIVDVAAPT